MKRFFLLFICCVICNGIFAQSLGKMTLGCKRTDIPFSLPRGYNVCKTSTDNQLTYATDKGDEYVSFYLKDGIVYKITMHKFVEYATNADELKSKLEELIMNLYETWGEPSHVGENIYWNFPSSKATFSYIVSTSTGDMDPLRLSGTSGRTTFYKCYADIKLEKRTNTSLFE